MNDSELLANERSEGGGLIICHAVYLALSNDDKCW